MRRNAWCKIATPPNGVIMAISRTHKRKARRYYVKKLVEKKAQERKKEYLASLI